MKTRIIVSVVLLPLFFAILFFFPPIILTAAISLLAAIGSFELMKAASDALHAPIRPAVYAIIIAAVVPPAVYYSSILMSAATMMMTVSALAIVFILMSLLVIDFLLTSKKEKRIKLRQLPVILAAAVIIPYMLSALISLRLLPTGHLLVLLPIIVTFLTDSGAYFTGMSIGKHKAFPTISPKKTVEGCIGGLVIGIAGMLIYGLIIDIATQHTIVYPLLIIYGLVGAVVTEAGDLVFSFIKRKCNVKDYGKIIPGHGGVLDRFDSMIFSAPTMFLLVTLLPAF